MYQYHIFSYFSLSHLCLQVTNTTTKLSQKVLLHFHCIFKIRGKRPFLINRTRTFAWKEPLPIAPPLPLGKLDNNLSPRVGDFAQKNHPRPKLPGGGDPRGYTWYFHKGQQPHLQYSSPMSWQCMFNENKAISEMHEQM